MFNYGLLLLLRFCPHLCILEHTKNKVQQLHWESRDPHSCIYRNVSRNKFTSSVITRGPFLTFNFYCRKREWKLSLIRHCDYWQHFLFETFLIWYILIMFSSSPTPPWSSHHPHLLIHVSFFFLFLKTKRKNSIKQNTKLGQTYTVSLLIPPPQTTHK